MDINKRVAQIITPTVEGLGFELVRVMLSGERHPRLQIMAEPVDGRPMDVEDCASLSRAISAVLDVEDPISSAYALEVSSPGIDRPLTKVQHFIDWAGFEAKIVLADANVSGRKNFSGPLLGVDDDDNILIEVDGETYALPFDDIQKAKLLLTDALIDAVTKE